MVGAVGHYFAVANGRNIGIYEDRELAQQQIKRFPNPKMHVCKTLAEAEKYIQENWPDKNDRLPEKVYAVAKCGKNVGIFLSWRDCNLEVKDYTYAKYRGFTSLKEAVEFIRENGTHTTKVWMAKQGNPVYYAVAKGRSRGIFLTKQDFSMQVNGLNYCPKFKQFSNIEDAALFMVDNDPSAAFLKDGETENQSLQRQFPIDSLPVKPSSQMTRAAFGGHSFCVDQLGYVHVYTDGACQLNGKAGARGGVGVWFDKHHRLNVSEPVEAKVATNNVAEMEAALKAIKIAKAHGIKKLQINTDSNYVIRCMMYWCATWKQNGWVKGSTGQEVCNRDILEGLMQAIDESIEIKWNYVPAHRGREGNEAADYLAKSGVPILRINNNAQNGQSNILKDKNVQVVRRFRPY